VPVQGADADARLPGDRLQRDDAVRGRELRQRGLDEALAVALRVGAAGGSRRNLRTLRFCYGERYRRDLRLLHRDYISCYCRAAEWGHKDVELAAHDLRQYLDRSRR